jgi:hypothetical protein
MLKATVIGKEETFRSLGIRGNDELELESLIIILRKQLEHEISETANADTEDFRSEALRYADHHPAFPLNWSENRLTRGEMNER